MRTSVPTPKCKNPWCRLPLRLVGGELVCPQCVDDDARLKVIASPKYRHAER